MLIPYKLRPRLRGIFSLATGIGAVAGILWLAGCASVPNAEIATRDYRRHAAQFKNAWGPISEKRSAAIVDELKRRSGTLDILDRQIALEQVLTREPLEIGNKVTLLQDGPATYDAMLRAIRGATDSINVESYIIEDGEVGRKFSDALIARQRSGVQVNVMYDSVGGFKTKPEFFDRLRSEGVALVEFNPINPMRIRRQWAINHRDHRKLLIVDGRTAFLGGINIDSVYSSGSSAVGSTRREDVRRAGWRDTDVQIDGPAVADFQRLFLRTWEKQRGPPLAPRQYLPPLRPQGREIVRAIGTSPDDAFSVIYLTLIAAITNAEKQVYITNAYFVPDPQLIDALLGAARRGVDVRLILPSTTDSRSAAYAAHSHYAELLRGGVRIYERQRALLHAKTAVVDGVWSCVGSSNLDWRSAVDNDEINAVILGPDFANRMLAAYAVDQARSDEISLEAWEHRPLRQRFKEWFFHLCGRLL